MGSCFLSFLEAQSKLLTSASDIMAPLGAYKEVGKGLNDSPSNSVVKEATTGWLAAAQVSTSTLSNLCATLHILISYSLYSHLLCTSTYGYYYIIDSVQHVSLPSVGLVTLFVECFLTAGYSGPL